MIFVYCLHFHGDDYVYIRGKFLFNSKLILKDFFTKINTKNIRERTIFERASGVCVLAPIRSFCL